MRGNCNTCAETKVELVHKQITPVGAKTMYQEAIANGTFVGTFQEYQDYMRGSITVSSDTGNWVINGEDTGVKAEGKDGITPTIGANGNWWVGSTDTGISAADYAPVSLKELLNL